MDISRSGSVASILSSEGSFSFEPPSRGGALLGSALWVGEGDHTPLKRRGCVCEVVRCDHNNFSEKLASTEWVQAIVFADQPLERIQHPSLLARTHVTNMGVGVPIYAATVAGGDAAVHQWCDVVLPMSQWQAVAEILYLKLVPRERKTDVLWCDPLAKSSTMHGLADSLAKLGLQVFFYEDPNELLQNATEDTAAIVTSGRGVPYLPKIRERLQDGHGRPLYWVVSTTVKMLTAYDNGADGAIVRDNPVLSFHKKHLRTVAANQPWMWHVVIGDLVSIIQAVGVTGIGGVQVSMPKLYDDLTWRANNLSLLFARGSRVFSQLAEVEQYDIVSVELNHDMNSHEARFQAAKGNLQGYVRDRILYHGTDEDVARTILRTKFKASGDGMYGPGIYTVDPTGLKKAGYFAMTKASLRDANNHSKRTLRTRGAIIAMRVAMCNTRIVDKLLGNNGTEWFKESTPCEECEDSVIGVCRTGYENDMDDIPEFVIRSPDLCVPVGVAIFQRRN